MGLSTVAAFAPSFSLSLHSAATFSAMFQGALPCEGQIGGKRESLEPPKKEKDQKNEVIY